MCHSFDFLFYVRVGKNSVFFTFSYYNSASSLFDCILEHNKISVHKHEGHLRHNYSMETVMDEFVKDIHDKSPDIKPKAFKSVVR